MDGLQVGDRVVHLVEDLARVRQVGLRATFQERRHGQQASDDDGE
jgi:hypothetical protein